MVEVRDRIPSSESFCCLTTRGRKTGTPRTIELWFAGEDGRIYMVAGGGMQAHWVRNIMADARVTLTIAGRSYTGSARVLDAESDREAWLRGAELCSRKYYGRSASYLARGWSPEAVVVEVSLEPS